MKYKAKYQFISIGKKIRELRKRNPDTKSQEAFIDVLKERYDFSISRNRLSRIENGDITAFSLDFLLCVSDLFNCDIGYLLGEYNEATAVANKICEITNLSEQAINSILGISLSYDGKYREALDLTISSPSFALLVYDIRQWLNFMDLRQQAISAFKGKIIEYEEIPPKDIISYAAKISLSKEPNVLSCEAYHVMEYQKQMDYIAYATQNYLRRLLDGFEKEASENGNHTPTNK